MHLKTAITTLVVAGLVACSAELPAADLSPEELQAKQAALAAVPRTKLLKTESSIPDRYIVVLKDGAATDVQSIATEQARLSGAQVVQTFQHAIKAYVMHGPESAARRLLDDPRVKYVEQDGAVRINDVQDFPVWGLDRIDQRWSVPDYKYTYHSTGAGVNVYVIDTGIRITHQDFGGRASHGHDSVGDGMGGNDCHGHGTHVAGTVGGTTWGVAKQANLFSVRVLDCTGGGTLSSVLEGIDWVTANRVLPAVANMSLGGLASQAVDDALTASVDSGVVYAAAAGNSAWDACFYSPARAPAALTVGATTDSDGRAVFSNYGTCVDLFAPGVGVISAWNTADNALNSLSGTSMASPHVAGAAALYLGLHPTATPAEVTAALKSEATPGMVSDPGPDSPNLLLFTGHIGGGDGGDTTPPVTTITAPSEGQEVSGWVTITADASDDVALRWGALYIDGHPIQWFPTAPYTGYWDTTAGDSWNGRHTIEVRVFDAAGNIGSSGVVTVNVNNPGAASYDPVLMAPTCATVGSICDTMNLVKGRGPFLGPESNAPNTIGGTCQDGLYGAYLSDESLERIRVSTYEGPLAPGQTAIVDVDVWAFADGTFDALDLFHAADATNPTWTYVTTLYPWQSGPQMLSTTFTLPSGGPLQAVRGNFRYGGSPNPCTPGEFDDRDDLVFAVQPPPVASFTSACNGLPCSFTDTSSTDGTQLVDWRWSFGDGASSTERNPAHAYAAPGTYTVSLTVTDDLGLTDTMTQSLVVNGRPPVASFNASCTLLSCAFTDASSDPDGTIVSWLWSFGNGYGSFLKNPPYTYAAAGTYVVSLTVTDNHGLTSTTMRTVTVTAAPEITLTATGSKVNGKRRVDLSWSGATSANVKVYRDGDAIATTPNDGAYRDTVNHAGTYTYRVCQPGTSFCSNKARVTFH